MTLSLDNQTANIVGQGPVPFCEAMHFATSEHVDLYAAILGMNGEILNLLCDPHHHFLHNNHLYIDRQPGEPAVIRRKSDGSLRTIKLMKAAVGKREVPTPAGVAVVLDIRPPQDPTRFNPLGPFTLRLDAKSTVIPGDAIDGWPGIMIHGTNCPKSCLGRAVTNGSIRVSNVNVTWLAQHIPIGTTVEII